jgi:hypothetical protein
MCVCAIRLLNDTGRVESELIKPAVLPTVISLFCTAQQAEFEKVVEELYAMMQKSTLLVKVYSFYSYTITISCFN